MRLSGGQNRTALLSRVGCAVCTIFVLLLTACSDLTPPAVLPASIRLVTEPAITVPVGRAFPVRVIVTDADDRAVAGATVVFDFIPTEASPLPPQADTARTDANGEARIDAVIQPHPGQYKIVVAVADVSIEPVVVNASVTPDAIARFELTPDSAFISLGGSVALNASAFDRFDNAVTTDGSFRNLTPNIIEISASGAGTATVTALAVGTGLIVAELGQLADTARVVVLTRVSQGLALGGRHSCELRSNGGVYCWGAAPGAGASAELCGASFCLRTPRQVASSLRFDSIAAGGDQTCALSGSALYCWGRGGAVPGGESTTPQRVAGGLSFSRSFTVGRDHACATVDGVAYCWGDNSRGQLGTGNRVAATTPTAVLTTQRFRFLRAGPQFTCGVTEEAAIQCWGANTYGQLGHGTTSDSELVPAAVVINGYTGELTNLSQGAGEHVCVPVSGNIRGMFCWGRNDVGQFGDGTTTSSPTPRYVSHSPFGLVTTATGTCAQVDILGACWGAIGGYQYDRETMYSRGSGLTAGDQHACAYVVTLTASGTSLRCWGDNSFGALGDGTMTSSRVPVVVTF